MCKCGRRVLLTSLLLVGLLASPMLQSPADHEGSRSGATSRRPGETPADSLVVPRQDIADPLGPVFFCETVYERLLSGRQPPPPAVTARTVKRLVVFIQVQLVRRALEHGPLAGRRMDTVGFYRRWIRPEIDEKVISTETCTLNYFRLLRSDTNGV